MKFDIANLESGIGIEFRNKNLLRQAFIHRSYLNENPDSSLEHNERLEFLGDAVLELIITEHLYNIFPEKPEGELTSLRASLVNAMMLGALASDLGFNNYLLLSRGEAKDVGRARQYILANTMEALIGALYLDQGYEAVKKFLDRTLIPRIPEILEKKLYRDPKSFFQEEAQERIGVTPTYKVIKEWGPDHDKHFVVGVYLSADLVAEGEGPSKQIAQQNAADVALKSKGWQ